MTRHSRHSPRAKQRRLAACLATALLALVVASASAPRRAQAGPLEAEMGLGMVLSSSDYVGLAGFMGVELAKPILGLCFLEPIIQMEYDLTSSTRLAALIRCNFDPKEGHIFSLGFGAGVGQHGFTDSSGNIDSTPTSFRELELGIKLGGKRRFGIELGWAFDHTSGPGQSWLLRLVIGRAYP